MKWICQTFWTKPMDEDKFKVNLQLCALSLYYAHKNGYKVSMHTDSKGFRILSKFGYDKLSNTLDSIPKEYDKVFFALPKVFALMHEKLGVLHMDYDVFIKKPCLDVWYNSDKYDCILQNREYGQYLCGYSALLNIFKEIGEIKQLPLHHSTPSNVGLIGFKNKEFKDEYCKRYLDCINYYNEYAEKFYGETPDLYFEQVMIDYLIQTYKYKPFYILPNISYGKEMDKYCNKIGYLHLFGSYKYTESGRKIIKKLCKKYCPLRYRLIYEFN